MQNDRFTFADNTKWPIDICRPYKMAELLSVQVHVPLTKTPDGQLLEWTSPAAAAAPSNFMRLKKIDNAAQDGTGAASGGATTIAPAQFDDLPRRRAVNIEFRGLTYTVSEGRKKGAICCIFIKH